MWMASSTGVVRRSVDARVARQRRSAPGWGSGVRQGYISTTTQNTTAGTPIVPIPSPYERLLVVLACRSSSLPQRLFVRQTWIEDIAQAIAEQIEGEYRIGNGQPLKDRDERA